MKYYIERTIGSISDTLKHLWEGDDLPTFKRDGNPYLFTDRATAERVLWRLQALGSKTNIPPVPQQDIKYELVPVDLTKTDETHYIPYHSCMTLSCYI